MASIVIRLDPTLLSDADADLRYDIPLMLEGRSNGLIVSDGYDYEEETDAMQIYLSTPNVEAAVPIVLDLLHNEHPFGNDLASAAMVGVSKAEGADAKEYEIVFPETSKGVIRARDGGAT